MARFDDLARERTDLSEADVDHLRALISDWTLLSDTAFSEHIGAHQSGDCEGPFEVTAKHDLQLRVYALKSGEGWSTVSPESSRRVVLGVTKLPKQVGGPFAERLRRAQRVALIQLTGRELLNHLREDAAALSGSLQTLRVYMPHPDSVADRAGGPVVREALKHSIEEWTAVLRDIKVKSDATDVRLGLFREAPYFGGSFVDWNRPGGQIHVSPYLWGVPARECPGFDLQWLGGAPSIVYATYQRALDNLEALSEFQTLEARGPTGAAGAGV